MELSRRDLLKGASALGAGCVLGGADRTLLRRLTAEAACGSLTGIEHVVILVQENRSFDHYFGAYKGVRGFDDRTEVGGAAAFQQTYQQPSTPTGYPDPMLPFHLSTAVGLPRQGQCTNDIEHQWAGQHASWNKGACDSWMRSHLATEKANGQDALQAAITMAYYDRSDLPFYYALADNFTICDNYFCSVIAGTDINRLYSMTGTIDPDGWDGGLQFLNTKVGTVQSPGADLGTARRWRPYPEVLSAAGVSWKCYGTPDGQLGDNVLRYFPQYRPVGGNQALSVPAFSSNAFPVDFVTDCLDGTLPQVSWLYAGLTDTEHAPDPLAWGESLVHTVLSGISLSGLWSSTLVILTYDENGGFFDHVRPPFPAVGTPGEFLNVAGMSATARTEATTVDGVSLAGDPIGLGFRVPTLVISPFSRNPAPAAGPLVCSERFDHTSLLRFLETWTAAHGTPARIPDRNAATRTPGLSAWRRGIVGDLTGALNLAAAPDTSVPTALLAMAPNRADPAVLSQCITTGTLGTLAGPTQPIVMDPPIPASVSQPAQEPLPGPVRRPSGLCAASTTPTSSGGTSSPAPGTTSALPNSIGATPAGAAAEMVAAGLLAGAAWMARRRPGPSGDPAGHDR